MHAQKPIQKNTNTGFAGDKSAGQLSPAKGGEQRA
jgi:hypothetical protein